MGDLRCHRKINGDGEILARTEVEDVLADDDPLHPLGNEGEHRFVDRAHWFSRVLSRQDRDSLDAHRPVARRG